MGRGTHTPNSSNTYLKQHTGVARHSANRRATEAKQDLSRVGVAGDIGFELRAGGPHHCIKQPPHDLGVRGCRGGVQQSLENDQQRVGDEHVAALVRLQATPHDEAVGEAGRGEEAGDKGDGVGACEDGLAVGSLILGCNLGVWLGRGWEQGEWACREAIREGGRERE